MDEKKEYDNFKEDRDRYSGNKSKNAGDTSRGEQKDLGDQIMDLIQDSIDSMDFSSLSNNIKKTVDYAKEEATRQIQSVRQKQTESKDYDRTRERNLERAQLEKKRKEQEKLYRHPVKEYQPKKHLRKLPGTYSGPIKTGVGGTGLAVFGSLSLGFGLSGFGMAAFGSAVAVSTFILEGIFLPLTILSGFLLGRGIVERRRTKRIRSYAEIWNNKSFVMLKDLIEQCGVKRKTLQKDLQFIMEKRLIPKAKIDRENTCLLLTEEARVQYDQAQKARKQREEEEQRKLQEQELRAKADPQEREMMEIQEKAKGYILQLREKNAAISSVVLHDKVEKMQQLVTKIFVCVKEHPENLSQTDRLLTYYLPSIVKLLTVYDELEDQPVEGENILKTKKEIEDSLDMINEALENMFDELFQGMAMDITSDIRVMEMMLAKDGWTEQELHSIN